MEWSAAAGTVQFATPRKNIIVKVCVPVCSDWKLHKIGDTIAVYNIKQEPL